MRFPAKRGVGFNIGFKDKVMATFEIKTKRAMNVQGDYGDAGLSVQISSMFSNPFDEVDKINKAFIRVHGINLKPEGYLSLEWLEYRLN